MDASELNLFLEKTDELINCKYILADSKIIGVLKSIACSKTLLAIIESSLETFDKSAAMEKYLIRSKDNEKRGEYVEPDSSADAIALSFTLLADIDLGKINFSNFLKEYFYGDGSVFDSYNLFVNAVVKPFKSTVKLIYEGILSGKIKDPKEEIRLIEKSAVVTKRLDEDKAVDETALGKAKRIVLEDKSRVLSSGVIGERLSDIIIIMDGILEALSESNKERIKELFVAYKYFALIYKRLNLSVTDLRQKLEEGKVL